MAKIEVTTIVNRPIEEVFALVMDISNATKWMTGVLKAEQTSPGPVGVGTTYRYVAQVMGRKLEADGNITAWEPPTRYGWKSTSGPFPMSGGMTFSAVEGGTRVTDTLVAEPGGFFKLAEPLLIKQQQGQMEKDMAKLKELLEKGA